VLGDGKVSFALTVKAAKFSATAAEKIAAAGGSTELVAGRKKWTKWGYKKEVADLKANGLDYDKVQQQKRVQTALNKKKRHAEEVEARKQSKATA
jgi:ribosomal protein L18E